jgi:hypothetical protein
MQYQMMKYSTEQTFRRLLFLLFSFYSRHIFESDGSLIQASFVTEHRQTKEAFFVAHIPFSASIINPMRWSQIHRLVALFLATNYFAFQIELFEEEYEANHPKTYDGASLTQPTLTWESFDKQNAPKAFVVNPHIHIEPLFVVHPVTEQTPDPDPPSQLIRDKSPPR